MNFVLEIFDQHVAAEYRIFYLFLSFIYFITSPIT